MPVTLKCKSRLWILGQTLLVAMLPLAACAAEVNRRWQRLPSLPDRYGVAGAFAGMAGGQLLVAGGTNFPEIKPWDGGKKIWHDTVYALANPNGKWREVGKLPRALGYGVSATVGDGVVCIGGSDVNQHYPDCFKLTVVEGRLRVQSLPALPIPLANAAGVTIGEVIYVCGGSDKPGEQSALNRLFALDLSANRPAWNELEPCPGRPRLLPVAAAVNGSFYLVGGADIVMRESKLVREYLADAWRYEPVTGWQQLARLPKPVVAAPSPAPVVGDSFFIMGGDDGSRVGFQPVQKHPGFSDEMFAYDTRRGEWRRAGKIKAPRVTTPVAWWQERWVIPSGEVRPGVRSPEVWAVTIAHQ